MNTLLPLSYLCTIDQADQRLQALRRSSHDAKDLSTSPRLWLLVPAAGLGTRAGLQRPKQYFEINGQTVLEHCLVALGEGSKGIQAFAGILVLLSPEDSYWQDLQLDRGVTNRLGPAFPLLALKIGGAERAQTVLAGLDCLYRVFGDEAQNDWVMVHDAARPFVTAEAIQRLWQQGQSDDGALLALPVADTLKRAQAQAQATDHPVDPLATTMGPKVLETVPRDHLWRAQTPQLFRLPLVRKALAHQPMATDESLAMEALGYRPRLVMGEASNIKLTFEQDFAKDALTMPDRSNLVEASAQEPPIRIGQGFDVHALVRDRPLILGGVRIAHETGLLGHSDADVLLHAISDALLGALGLGDIGRHFPDTDAAFKNIDSRLLLRKVVQVIREQGFRVAQIDATLIAQRPKLMPYIDAMAVNISQDCDCDFVNVKATTTEKLGFAGREEGIAAQAIASLVRA
jgi:2-C-methyl-D-erythritol 4-phosphate cytidylyltransferase/2-C-methyl-D-erythritol 2,4-cyclodiphosphate synthase